MLFQSCVSKDRTPQSLDSPNHYRVANRARGEALGTYKHNGRVVVNEPSVDPFFESVDRSDSVSAKEDEIACMAEALGWLIRWCWLRKDGTLQKTHAALSRFALFSTVVFHGVVPKTLDSLASDLGKTRASLSWFTKDLTKKTGIWWGLKKHCSTRLYAANARRMWAKRKHVSHSP